MGRKMQTAFDRCRDIPAVEVARTAGIPLRRHGNREWCCCPIHKEKTPSCCFYPNGRWYCFGCHAGGDAVDLYVALHGGSKLEAANALANIDLPHAVIPSTHQSRPAFLDTVDQEGLTWDQLCAIRNRAACELENSDDPWFALKIKSEAEMRLDEMEAIERDRQDRT